MTAPRGDAPDGLLRGGYLVRREVLDRVGSALREARTDALLVKGAGLAETVYREPWRREMADVDLVVRTADLERTLDALAGLGAEVLPVPRERRHSYATLSERAAIVRVGPAAVTVEIHTSLDKVVPHRIDWPSIFLRAAEVAGLPTSLRVPSLEDHALLVIVHAALSDLRHPVAWDDLDRLWRAGLDDARFAARATDWKLATASTVVLEAWATRHPEHDVSGVVRALGVGALRRRLVSRAFVDSAPRTNGWRWTLRQSALRDDPLRYAIGLTSYALRRAADRFA